MRRRRNKESCFRCRALHVSNIAATCELGWPLSIINSPVWFSFYCPGEGVKCQNPLTWTALAEAKKARETKDENQLSLL
jgi:hypothetical protein